MSGFTNLSRESIRNIFLYFQFPSFSTIDSTTDNTIPIPKILRTCFGYYCADSERKIILLNKYIHIRISPAIGHKTILRKCWIPWEIVWKITYEDGQFSAESDRTVSNLLVKRVFTKCQNLHELGWNFGRILNEELLSKIIRRGDGEVKFPNFNNNIRMIHWPQSEKISPALKSFPKLEKVLLYRIQREDDRFGKVLGNHKGIKELAIVKCNEKQFRYSRKNNSLEDIYVDQIFSEETTRFVLLTHQSIQKISTPVENMKVSNTNLLGQNFVLKELYLWGSGEVDIGENEDVMSILSHCHVKKLTLVDCKLLGQDLSVLFSSPDGISESIEEFEINDEPISPTSEEGGFLSLRSLGNAENLRVMQISAITSTENICEFLSSEPLSLTDLSFTMGVEWGQIREVIASKCHGLKKLQAKRNILDDDSFFFFVERMSWLERLKFRPKGCVSLVEWQRKIHGEDNKSFLERVKKKFSAPQQQQQQTMKKKKRPSPSQSAQTNLLASLHITGMVLKKAERAFKKKKFSMSYELVDQLIRGDQGNSLFLELFLHRAKSSWKLGKYNRCLFDASHVLDKDPGNKDAFKFAVESSLKLGRYRELVVLMRDSSSSKKGKGGAWEYLDELVKRNMKKSGKENLIKCGNCGKFSYSLLQCVRCKKECYCNRECQVEDYPKHKEICNKN